MKFIIFLVVLALLYYFVSAIWPILLSIAIIVIAWKIYEAIYYKSSGFLNIKNHIESYINECNELNNHIEELKDTKLIVNNSETGKALYYDTSKHNYKRKHLKDQKYAPNIHNCSRTVCDNARKKPFEYVCKYFGIKATEDTLENFENLLNNFEAAEEGKRDLELQKNKIIDSIKNDVPFLIRKLSKKLERKLGFNEVDMSTDYFPKYIFKYISSGGNASTECDVIMDIENLNKFIVFLSEKINLKNSAAGQRALMTSKLRQKIKERDNFTCKKCGISVKNEPHLLLEVDHIIPISKGGLTTEDNLQTLCWKCNRTKGAKILD